VLLKTRGDGTKVRAFDDALTGLATTDWFAKETLLFVKRTLKRLDLTAKSLFAILEPGSAFVGSLFELALASDRSFMKAGDEQAFIGFSTMSFGPLPMSNGLTRLETRFLHAPERVPALGEERGLLDPERALALGLVTFTPDEIDWEDEVRIAIEERVSLSPDALTGMEANLRFAGPETTETKIFARLSAWQNWIFQRPNAVGERGALTMYGRPERPEFDWRRT
jgi:benzoyl-CoA-dihydrodiol lyase